MSSHECEHSFASMSRDSMLKKNTSSGNCEKFGGCLDIISSWFFHVENVETSHIDVLRDISCSAWPYLGVPKQPEKVPSDSFIITWRCIVVSFFQTSHVLDSGRKLACKLDLAVSMLRISELELPFRAKGFKNDL